MRNKIIVGLTTALTAASIAAPAMAAAPAAPAPAGANSPQLHLSTCVVKTSPKGFVYATCGLTSINMGNQTVYVQYHSNMKTFEPAGRAFSAQNGILGVPGTSKVYNRYSLRFAFQHKTAAQVRKSLKVTINNATGGALITAGTATA
jgi:hypothetical protein